MRPFEDARIAVDGASRAAATCVCHLTALGGEPTPGHDRRVAPSPRRIANLTADVVNIGGNSWDGTNLQCRIAHPTVDAGIAAVAVPATGVEVFAQAMSGLMAVHGRDVGRPRRLGLDVASQATGVLASTGLLALELGRRRGMGLCHVETSPVLAALTFLTHHIAMETCADRWEPESAGDASGPPFATRDGVALEVEAASLDGWAGFWADLGVDLRTAEAAWPGFAYRYDTAACSLPAALHAAIARRSLDEVSSVAASRRISVCRQRGYREVLESRDWTPDAAGAGSPRTFSPPSLWLTRDATAAPVRREPRPDARRSPLEVGGTPLVGMRVVEATHGLPGPLAGQLLRMLGAEVIRIEPPGGDPARWVRPLAGSVGAGFVACNRGKTAVEIDYKKPEGRAAIAELAAGADVFLHNSLPGRADAFGFDAATLGAVNPALVHAWISGWGGALRADERVGIEYFAQAHCGCADGLTPLGSPPRTSRLILAGVMAALLACEATVAALCEREQRGRGRVLETSLFLGAMALQAGVLEAIAEGREENGRRCGRPVWDALDQPLATRDGHLCVAAGSEDERRLFACCGVDADASGAEQRLAEALAGRTAREWEDELLAAGVAAVEVRGDLASLLEDPLAATSLERVAEGPDPAGSCWAPASPWRFAP